MPQFCIVATVSCFCYDDEPYYYMMYLEVIKNSEVGHMHVNPRLAPACHFALYIYDTTYLVRILLA